MLSVLLFLVTAWQPAPQKRGGVDADFRAFLTTFEAGLDRFVNGDPTIWKQNLSRRNGTSIMGGWGGYEIGGEVEARYDWAVEQFRDSGARMKVEYLTTVGADLAYTVSIEQSQVRIGEGEKPVAIALRVTHLFGKEDGAWKLVHRHADHAVVKVAPAKSLAR
jgi:hypothetical protein